jgi:hypothetical protein
MLRLALKRCQKSRRRPGGSPQKADPTTAEIGRSCRRAQLCCAPTKKTPCSGGRGAGVSGFVVGKDFVFVDFESFFFFAAH